MSYVLAGIAAAAFTVNAYSTYKQQKVAKQANANAERQNRLQAEDNANALRVRQEQMQKPVADVAAARTAPQPTKLRKQQGLVSRSLNL